MNIAAKDYLTMMLTVCMRKDAKPEQEKNQPKDKRSSYFPRSFLMEKIKETTRVLNKLPKSPDYVRSNGIKLNLRRGLPSRN